MRRLGVLAGLTLAASACAITIGPIALDDHYVGFPGQTVELAVTENDHLPDGPGFDLRIIDVTPRTDAAVVAELIRVELPGDGPVEVTYEVSDSTGTAVATAVVELGQLDVETLVSRQVASLDNPLIPVGALVESRLPGGPWLRQAGIEVVFDLIDFGAGTAFRERDRCTTDESGMCEIQIVADGVGRAAVTAYAEMQPGQDGVRVMGNTIDLTWLDTGLFMDAPEFVTSGEPVEVRAVAVVDGGEGPAPVPGVDVEFDVIGPVSRSASLAPITCRTGVDGGCSVEVIVGEIGDVVVTARAVIDVAGLSMERVADAPMRATSLEVELFEAGLARAGEAVEVTARVTRDVAGTTEVVPGANVSFSIVDGEAEPLFRGPPDCVTDEAGTCNVLVVGRSGGAAVIEAVAAAQPGGTAGAVIETRWADARLTLAGPEPLAPNTDGRLVATLEVNDGTGWVRQDNAKVAFSIIEDNTGAELRTNSCGTASGSCGVTIENPPQELGPSIIFSFDLGTGIASVQAEAPVTVAGVGIRAVSDPVEVRWVNAAVRLSASDTEPVSGQEITLTAYACINEGSPTSSFLIFVGGGCGSGFAPQSDIRVSFSVSDPDDAPFVTFSQLTCTTGADGSCDVAAQYDGTGSVRFVADAVIPVLGRDLERTGTIETNWSTPIG